MEGTTLITTTAALEVSNLVPTDRSYSRNEPFSFLKVGFHDLFTPRYWLHHRPQPWHHLSFHSYSSGRRIPAVRFTASARQEQETFSITSVM